MIAISNLSFSYSKKAVLKNLNLEIKEGEFIAIIGPTGCGKTTFLKLIADLIERYEGEIKIGRLNPSEFRKQEKYAYFFQEANLFPWMNVKKNIELPLKIQRKEGKIEEVLKLVKLKKSQSFYPHQISGGMKQKVSLARGLILEPELLLMDEPFAGLDEISRENLNEELLRIWQTKEQTVVFVTHSISEAVFLADRVVVFSQEGELKKIFENKLARPRNKKMRKSEDFFKLCNELRDIIS